MREILVVFLGLSGLLLLIVSVVLDRRKYKLLFKSDVPVTQELFVQRDKFAFSMLIKAVVLFVLAVSMQLPLLLSALR